MRLELRLPSVEPDEWRAPSVCRYAACGGQHFRLHQVVAKSVPDTVYETVTARRYQCLRCRRTFRVYLVGVDQAPTSQRVKGLAVMLYLLGLSYGAVALALDALGAYLCKTQVIEAVQAAAQRVPGLKRRRVFAGVRTPALGADVTSVKCRGRWLQLGLSVDAVTGVVLSVERLPNAEAQTRRAWLAPLAAPVGAELLVSDDADAFPLGSGGLRIRRRRTNWGWSTKSARRTRTSVENSRYVFMRAGVATTCCLRWGRCVVRNTDGPVETLTTAAGTAGDASLAALGVSPAQAAADVRRLGELIHSRQRVQAAELAGLAARYALAKAPKPGQSFSLAYRLRLIFLDRWNLWGRLTRYTCPNCGAGAGRTWWGQPASKWTAPTMPASGPLAGS